jgi:peptide-methionine (R)-S-oxide reductase
MKTIGMTIGLLLLAGVVTAPAADQVRIYAVEKADYVMSDKVVKTEAEWRAMLTPLQYEVMREHGTESAYTSPLHDSKTHGLYRCAGCGLALFHSDQKYDSRTGWPSFYAPIDKSNLGFSVDKSFFMTRTEVHCVRCKSHLGHVFEDGPKPTGLRYCLNGVSLTFEKEEKG